MGSGSGGGGSSSSSSSVDKNITRKAFGILIFPIIILGVYAAIIPLTSGIFKYTIGAVEYDIGTQGYTVNGVQAIASRQFDYPTPETWPQPIRGLPKLLVAHLAAVCVLGAYIIIYITHMLTLYYNGTPVQRQQDPKRGLRAITPSAQQKGGMFWITLLVCGMVLALGIANLALVQDSWKAADATGTFWPSSLGWALGIVGGLFAAFWLAMIIVYRYVYRDKVAEAQPKKK